VIAMNEPKSREADRGASKLFQDSTARSLVLACVIYVHDRLGQNELGFVFKGVSVYFSENILSHML